MFIRVEEIQQRQGADKVRVIFMVAPTREELDKNSSMSQFGVDMESDTVPVLGAVEEIFKG